MGGDSRIFGKKKPITARGRGEDRPEKTELIWAQIGASIMPTRPLASSVTPAMRAESARLGAIQAAWEAGLPRPKSPLDKLVAEVKKSDVYKVAVSVAKVVTSPTSAIIAAATGNKEAAKLVANKQDVKNTAAVAAVAGLAVIAAGAVAAAGAAGGSAGTISVAGMNTGLSTGFAGLNTVAGTAATGAVTGATGAALNGQNIKQGAQAGAAQGAINSTGAALKPYVPALNNVNLSGLPQLTGGQMPTFNTGLGNTLGGLVSDYQNIQGMLKPTVQPLAQIAQLAAVQAPQAQAAQPVSAAADANKIFGVDKKIVYIGGALFAALGLVLVASR